RSLGICQRTGRPRDWGGPMTEQRNRSKQQNGAGSLQLIEMLGTQAKKLAGEVPGGLRRVSLRAGDATVEMEWTESAVGNGIPTISAASVENRSADDGVANVVAPLVGTFYHAPEPGGTPFVRVGDVVTADTVVGIVEAMKMMNEVRAGLSGRVVAVLVKDGEPAEYGQPLIELVPVHEGGE